MQIGISVSYIAIWENLTQKWIFVVKQGLEEMRYLKPKVKKKKKRSETNCGRPNIALHLNE